MTMIRFELKEFSKFRCHQLFSYDKVSGFPVWNKVPREFYCSDKVYNSRNDLMTGRPAMTGARKGGYFVKIPFYNITLNVAKLVWFWHFGYIPKTRIYFLNDSCFDTRIENLTLQKPHKYLHEGIVIVPKKNKFYLKVCSGKDEFEMGPYKSLDIAIEKRNKASGVFGI